VYRLKSGSSMPACLPTYSPTPPLNLEQLCLVHSLSFCARAEFFLPPLRTKCFKRNTFSGAKTSARMYAKKIYDCPLMIHLVDKARKRKKGLERKVAAPTQMDCGSCSKNASLYIIRISRHANTRKKSKIENVKDIRKEKSSIQIAKDLL